MIFSDSYVEKKSTSFIFLTLLGLFASLYMEYISISALLNSFEKIQLFNKYFIVFSMASFVSIIVAGYILSGILHLIDGKRLICKLSIDDRITIKNSMLNELEFTFNDVISIINGQKKLLFKNVELFLKGSERGFTINLKDGRFFRVSPHMERIDELKAELERIIAENKTVVE
tara:strand:+ start:304 stop:822 length:519 start_codon:yes stop_codon:yes gene_type:complete